MKKIIYIAISVIGIILIISGLRVVNNYYDTNYKGQIAYSKIPNKIPTKEPAKDPQGKRIKGMIQYDYKFKFIDKNGKEKTINYLLSGEKVKPFKPNVYFKAEISSSRVTNGPNYISKNDIPKNIVNKIK